MRNKSNLMKGQSGQIMAYTIIILMLAGLIIAPLLSFTYGSWRAVKIREERTLELYASDAGIEDSLYQIKTEKKGTGLGNLGFGGNSSFNVGTPDMNDRTETVSVEKVWLPGNLTGNLKTDAPVNDDLNPSNDTDKSDRLVVAGMLSTSQATAVTDDFSSGWPNGGTGNWTGAWTGNGTLGSGTGSCGTGNCLKFEGASGYAERTANLLKYMKPQLKFTARASSFGGSDSVALEAKYGNSSWEPVESWAQGDETPTCNAFNIDLSADPYYWGGSATSVPLSLRFDANLHTTVVASDDFEPPNNTWSGGFGWARDWARSTGSGDPTGETAILTGDDGNGNPPQGTYYLRLRSNDGYAKRMVDLSGYTNPHLQFWAKATSFEGTENARFLTRVGNGGSFTTRLTWVNSGTAPLTDDNVYHYFDLDLSQYGAAGQSKFWIAFEANMGSTTDYFYVDDIEITQGSSFYADNLWIGDEYNSNTIEIAYIDPNFDPTYTLVPPQTSDPAYLDRIGVWMPPGCTYMGIVGNDTTVGLAQPPTTILLNTYAGGTILEWDFSPPIDLSQPVGGSTAFPIVRSLAFTYTVNVTQDVAGVFTWIKAHGVGNRTYISWDKGYEVYKAVSQAHSDIFGSNTQVTAYVTQGEVNKKNVAAYGDYVAAGNPLLVDLNGDDYKESPVDPSNPTTWGSYGGITYDGRDEIGTTTIPSDAKVVAGWLYWSGYIDDTTHFSGQTDWERYGQQPDTNVSFMYPKRYGSESFTGNATSLTYIVNSYKLPSPEPMDLLAHDPVLTLSSMRYLRESLGTLILPHGNVTFFTAHKPISPSLAPVVKVGVQVLSQSGNYTANYTTGNVTIINTALSGQVTIDYSVPDSKTLVRNTDYTIISDVVSGDTRYKGFTIINSDITGGKLQGTVNIDYYYAKHWTTVNHAAYDRYGAALGPALAHSMSGTTTYVGWAYDCFRDVTDLLTGNGTYTDVSGRGQYAVGNVTSSPGTSAYTYRDWCYSGWSLIVLYESLSETAHQFYLYDPIHSPYDPILHPDGVPFMMTQVSAPSYHDVFFTLKDFYPPEGTVDGRTTCYVGEGDIDLTGDSVGFKGASQTSYTLLHDPNPGDPNFDQNNVMNCLSTTGEKGIDLDTYHVTSEVGSDTEANVRLRTQQDVWYLAYMILSFKTNQVPKPDFAFDVASVTYQYELNQ